MPELKEMKFKIVQIKTFVSVFLQMKYITRKVDTLECLEIFMPSLSTRKSNCCPHYIFIWLLNKNLYLPCIIHFQKGFTSQKLHETFNQYQLSK